jgi:hypothetical protein
MASRITYDSNTIDIRMDRRGPGRRSESDRKVNRSGYGTPEIIVFSELIRLRFRAYFSDDTLDQLWAWWSWAEQGGEFSYAVDSAYAADTTLDGTPTGSPSVIPVTATTGFSVGDKCWIQKQDRTDFEPVTIQSISDGASVTATAGLKFSGYASGDTFRHKEYFPNLVTEQKSFAPVPTDIWDPDCNFYWTANFDFSEAPG